MTTVNIPRNTRPDCEKTLERETEETFQERWNMEGKEVYSQNLFIEKAISFIRGNKDKPFFLYHPTQLPHGPVAIPEVHPDFLKDDRLTQIEKEYASMIKMLDDHVARILKELEVLNLDNNTMIIFKSDNGHEKYGIDQFPFWDPEVEPYQTWHRKWEHLGEVDPDGRKRYLLQLEVMDAGIGTILDALEETGELENTIILFTSDNGGELSTYSQNEPLNGYKYMFGEGGIRVPMILSYPRMIKKQKFVTPKVSLMDVIPTILETIGVELPADLDGKSLWPAIEENQEIHDYLVWSNGRETWVVRKGKWKLARNIGFVHNTYNLVDEIAYEADSHYLFPGGIRLIDLDQDIDETTNMAEQYPEVVRELEQIYHTWRSEMSDPRTRDGVLKVPPPPGDYIGNSLKDLGAEVWADGSEVDNYPGRIIDGYDATYWKYSGGDSSKPVPHYVIIDLKSEQTFSKIEYIPAPDRIRNRISAFNIYASESPFTWGDPVLSGTLPNNSEPVNIDLGRTYTARYIIVEAAGVYGTTYEVAITSIDIIP